MISVHHVCTKFCVQLYTTPWTIACQAALSMGFSRHKYWSELPCPPPGDLPDLGIEPQSLPLLHWQVGSLSVMPPGKPSMHHNMYYLHK